MKKVTLLILIFILQSCSTIPYKEINTNFVKNYCKGKEYFEDTLYFTNEFVENHKVTINSEEISCSLFEKSFEEGCKFNYFVNGGFNYTKKYPNDEFLDTIKKDNLKTIFCFKVGQYKQISYNLVQQNGIWKIHEFYFHLTNQTVDPVEE